MARCQDHSKPYFLSLGLFSLGLSSLELFFLRHQGPSQHWVEQVQILTVHGHRRLSRRDVRLRRQQHHPGPSAWGRQSSWINSSFIRKQELGLGGRNVLPFVLYMVDKEQGWAEAQTPEIDSLVRKILKLNYYNPTWIGLFAFQRRKFYQDRQSSSLMVKTQWGSISPR